MKRNPPNRSNLFLMELIITILFFAIASALCMQLFVKAKTLSDSTSEKNRALTTAKDVSTAFSDAKGDIDAFLSALPPSSDYTFADNGENIVKVYYDSDWQGTSKQTAVYTLTATWHPHTNYDNISTGHITLESDEVLLTLSLSSISFT